MEYVPRSVELKKINESPYSLASYEDPQAGFLTEGFNEIYDQRQPINLPALILFFPLPLLFHF
jgi:hypothetical protein